MKKYKNDNPEFSSEIDIVEVTDPNHADNINKADKEIFENTLVNRQDIQQLEKNKVDKVAGKQLSTNDYTTAEKNKLNGIAEKANNYLHPASHPADMITQDKKHRFVSDTEKTDWNDANSKKHTHSNKSVLDGITSALIASWNKITDKLDKTGDASNTTTSFSTASTRSNISTGEKLAISLGKIAKFFTDLKTVAFTGSYTDLSNKPNSLPANGGNASTVNGHTINSDVPAGAKFTDTNTTYNVATQSVNGLLSAIDKKKLDGIATSANNYSHPTNSGNKHIPSGGSAGQILRWSSDGTATWGADNNTTYGAGRGLTLNGTQFGLADICTTVTDWNVVTTTGFYMSLSAKNTPIVDSWFYGIVIAYDIYNVRQILYRFAVDDLVAGTNCDKYERIKHAGAWGSWVNTSVKVAVPSNAKFTDTTYTNFVKSGTGAKAGLVPAPSTTAGTTKYLREDGTWQVPPNTNTTYGAGTGIGLSNTTFYNTGVRGVATGSKNGTMAVNTNGTVVDVPVKGLGTLAYASGTWNKISGTNCILWYNEVAVYLEISAQNVNLTEYGSSATNKTIVVLPTNVTPTKGIYLGVIAALNSAWLPLNKLVLCNINYNTRNVTLRPTEALSNVVLNLTAMFPRSLFTIN